VRTQSTKRPRTRAALIVSIAAVALSGCGPPTPSGPSGGPPASGTSLPNGLIEIGGGRHLDIRCSGSRPVVVLDAGLGIRFDVWSSVVPKIEGFATVCAYNPAGLRQSDPRPAPHAAAATNGIESIKKNAPTASTDDETGE